MLLSFLIFLPLSVFPTLFFLKKDFQVKAILFSTSLIHMFFSIGLISKSGYGFRGVKLKESWPIFKSIGFDYSIGLDVQSLLAVLFVSVLFFILSLFSMRTVNKKNVYLMLLAQSSVLGMAVSQNLLLFLVFLEVGFFSLLILGSFDKESVIKALKLNLTGLALFLCFTTVFSVLYESIHAFPSLDFKALSSMRTPFIRGSFFSTQTILFLSFSLSFVLNVLAVFYLIKISKSKDQVLRSTQFLFFLTILLFGFNKMFGPLFPEVSSVYFSLGEGVQFKMFLILGVSLVFLYGFKALILCRKEVV